MALTERTRLYEVLVRVNPDLTIGSSYKNIYELLRDGVVAESRELAPQPLADVSAVTELLGAGNLDVLTRNASLTAEVTFLSGRVADLSATLDGQTQQLNEVTATNAALLDQVAVAQAEIARLTELLNPTIDPPDIVEVHPD